MSGNKFVINPAKPPLIPASGNYKSLQVSTLKSNGTPQLVYASNGVLDNYSPPGGDTTGYPLPWSSLTGVVSTRYGKTGFSEMDPFGMRSGNTFTVSDAGWYQLNFYLCHVDEAFDGSGVQVGLGRVRIGVRFGNATRSEFSSTDTATGVPEGATYFAIVNFDALDTFEIYITTISETGQDFIIRNSILKINEF